MADGQQVSIAKGAWEGYQLGKQLGSEVEFLVRAGRSLVYLICRPLSLSVEVFLRHSFGERYLTVPMLIVSFLLLSMGITTGSMAVTQDRVSEAAAESGVVTSDTVWAVMPLVQMTIGGLLILSFVVAVLFHLVGIHNRNCDGIRWHSRCHGVSWSIWSRLRLDPWRVVMYYEPLLVAAFGLVCSIGTYWGFYFVLVAGAMFIKGRVERSAFRKQVLDIIDNQIEAEFWPQAASGSRRPKETDGLVVTGARSTYDHERTTLSEITRRLDPGLRLLLEPKTAAPPHNGEDMLDSADDAVGEEQPQA